MYQMTKEQRQNTWMNITINEGYGDGMSNHQISIQDFLDGDIS